MQRPAKCALGLLLVLNFASAQELTMERELPEPSQKKRGYAAAPDLASTGASEWTSWFNVDHPGGDGDYESLEAIRFYYRERLCARPIAIEARTTEWVPPEETGEIVHYSPEKGFWCVNKEQPEGVTCSNYHVRFQCPLDQLHWLNWSRWSACSQTACGAMGIQIRQRSCEIDNANPSSDGPIPKCEGHAIERRVCTTTSCTEAKWGKWSPWTPCTKTCGGGRRVRRRSCQKSSKKSLCVGRPIEVQKCAGSPCQACPLTCIADGVNKDCSGCSCHDHVLEGRVFSTEGMPLANAKVALQEKPLDILTTSGQSGGFRVLGICADGKTNVTIRLEKYAPATLPTIINGSKTSSVQVVLRRVEKPYILKHPESRVRAEGQRVAFCCDATGTPVPFKYYWYHNETLLDKKVYKYDKRLILRNLQPQQAGTYHCKASSNIGVMKSASAHLTVVGKGQSVCDSKPQEHQIKMPTECFQAATRSHYYNVGKCPNSRCAGKGGSDLQCNDSINFCCGVKRMEIQEVKCLGYTLPIKVVTECGCAKCIKPKMLVRGRVVAVDNGEPLQFGEIFIGKEQVGFTGYKGAFTIEVPPNTKRLVVKFVDRFQKFLDTIKVFPFDERGGSVYHDVKVMRKKDPIDLDAKKTNTIILGDAEEENPIGEIVIPPNSFITANGEVYNGTVKASVTFLDPRNITAAAAASSDLTFVNNEGDLIPLRTYGMFAVDFREEASNEVLQTGQMEVHMDVEQIKMPEHIQKMKLWSLNPETGIWEEESEFQYQKNKRKKREERTFLIGNLQIRERRLFNLDVPEYRRCFVKVRAYMNEKFIPNEQMEGVVINLINLEPMAGFSSNPRAWGRFDSVITGPNGACLPAFCDEKRVDAYTAYVTATLGGEEMEAAPSTPRLNPNIIGVSQPYLNKLGYRRTDHEDSSFKKTAFKINLAKPNPNNIDETNGPIYAYRNFKGCDDAPVSANHFRFYRVEADKYEYNVVPFQESDLTSWTGDYLSWWPNPQEFRACFIKVKLNGPVEYIVRSQNVGGTHPRTRGRLYGIRDIRSVRDMTIYNSSAACVEFKCSGMLFDQAQVDRTVVSIMPQGSCRRTLINPLLQEYLNRHPPLIEQNDTSSFGMLAPVDPLGHNYGIYTVTDQNPRLAKEIAIGRCFDGTSDGFSREMKSDMGTALTFTCQEKAVTRHSFFQRLLTSPGDTLSEIRRGMRENEQLQGPSQVVPYPAGMSSRFPSQSRRITSIRRRVNSLRSPSLQ
uniref:Cartilage intermediate layer protein 2 n=1 Tax=Geotrypetes seraphini TaxID=260995 RepID=A0A6P8S3D7_GEOSA|nr:cartilage intermediate layer protein 2 [Geotrypetes seraphini]